MTQVDKHDPGSFSWPELATSDPAAAKTFYTSLFGWGAKVSPEYTEWQRGDSSIGGMMKIPKEWGSVPPNWLVYFAADDVDATAAKAKQAAGRSSRRQTSAGPFRLSRTRGRR
jgi:predicted enzyme related to lactoylglutathione lyase